VPAEFQLVFAPPYWDQVNNSWINNQHINVTGTIEVPVTAYVPQRTGRLGDIPVRFGDGDFTGTYRYVADVNPAVVSMRTRRQIISEQEVISLFYSNKTIEHLLQSDLAAAYAYAKVALQTFPQSSLAWNNLGVLYSRVNQTELAEAAYQIAVSADDNAYSARSNLARLYRRIGQEESAKDLERQIANFRESNPYYHAALAEAEMEKGNLLGAQSLYREALQRKHNEQHFYHQLAIISQALGDDEEVKEHLRSARRYARGEERTRFANKLQALEDLL
jgi:tetratricopeptide (TPR) repeat protein